MRITRRPRTMILVALLCGCAAPLDNSGYREQFVTHIYDNGTKLFRYQFARSDRLRPIIPFDQSGGFTDGKQVYSAEELRRKNKRFLRDKVERRLENTGYCRSGFFTLDTLVSYGNASLRGECREAASAEDRQRFPNTERESVAAQPPAGKPTSEPASEPTSDKVSP